MTHPCRSGGQILVDALSLHGVELVFGVPGESYLAALDALRDSPIRFIATRHEGGAAFMAEAYGKLSGRPGVCFVTRGPGAANAAIGVHTARQDSTPLILLIGQVGAGCAGREAFQEVDYRQMFGPLAKWVAQVERAERLPEYLARAFQLACGGRPGPVVLALPEDVLGASASVADARPYQPVQAAPAAGQIARVRALLAAARRPLLLLGGSTWDGAACADLRRFAEANALPVACAWRRQDLLDNAHPNYIGALGLGANPKLAARLAAADLILALGARLDEISTAGYTLPAAPLPRQRLIHVYPGVDELGSVYQADLLINSGMPQAAAMLAAMQPVEAGAWRAALAPARAELAAHQARPPACADAALDLWQVVQEIMAQAPADTILANGAGNFAGWAQRFYRYGALRSQLAPTSGAMGYGVPAAIAAKLAAPERTVIALAGDGDYLMNGQELATAVQYRAGLVVIVFNNGMYGTIRMHQERAYPGRVSGTALRNPDFAALARAYGAHGETVAASAEFGPALRRALAHARGARLPALIELRCDAELITPDATLTAIRRAAAAAR